MHTERLKKLDCLYEKAKGKLIENAGKNNQVQFWRYASICNRLMKWKLDILR